jgi:AraC-like DNA-binding protein
MDSMRRTILGSDLSIAYVATEAPERTENAGGHALIVCAFSGTPAPARWRMNDGHTLRSLADSGSIYYVPTGRVAWLDWEDGADCLVLYLEPELVASSFSRGVILSIKEPHGLAHSPDQDQLRQALRDECRAPEPCTNRAEALALELLGTVRKQLQRYSQDDDCSLQSLSPRAMQRVDAYIRTHLGNEILSQDLAKAAGLPLDRFIPELLRATGCLPQRYVLRRRLHEASRILSQRYVKIQTVARAVGFRDPTNFSERFKAAYGCRPKTFRRMAHHAADPDGLLSRT